MSQFELFEPPVDLKSTVPTAESARARLGSMLASLRVAETLPLTSKQLAFWTVVVPQMTNWLPEEEKASVQAEFDAHIVRLAPEGT